ncbi:fibronectin type III domain protein [Candidatus Vecturithrix granuli]|uniref:Fibronectin type III domain protein n=1 Tax=Vecturithrix granuli TaxID=1499967 RepID=A0A081C4A5_VECG1|nr:fibronectin type III domain protein [Candidatus Vecturithrix granuli]
MSMRRRSVFIVICSVILITGISPVLQADIITIDNKDAGFSTVGSWYTSTTVPGYYGSNYHWAYAGTGSRRATWTFTVPATGYYQVSAWWSSPYSTRASNAPYTINHANGATKVVVDQRSNGGQWNPLGTYQFQAGTATVVLSNDADNNPVADAVKLESVSIKADFVAGPLIGVAPLEVSFTDQSQGTITNWLWEFGDGTTSREQHPTHIYSTPGTYSVSLTITGDSQEDTLTKTRYITISELWTSKIIDNSESDFSVVGDWPASTLVSGYYGTNYQWSYAGTGTSKAIWTFYIPVEGDYQVSAWWSNPYSTRPSNAPYTITHAQGTTRVEADQRSNGGQWNPLGIYHFLAGTTTVVLSNDADNVPVADAVKLEVAVSTPTPTPIPTVTPTPIPTVTPTPVPTATPTVTPSWTVMIIDNEDSKFSTVGDWPFSTLISGYYGNNYQWSYGGDGTDKAIWTITIPEEGDYRVSAWWSSPYSTRASNVPYIITHAEGSARIEVDQQSNGGQWNDLGTYHFLAGETTVVVTNETDGNPVADAIKFQSTLSLEADFTATPLTGLAPLEVQFTDNSLGEIVSWLWEFGDGTTSTEQHPTHSYEEPGTYTVQLTVTDSNNQEETIFKSDYVIVSDSDIVAYEFIWPIEEQDFFIFQAFGNKRLEQSGYHAGTDFAVYRTDVNALNIANGWVQSFNGFGNAIMIKHLLPNGEYVYSWYNHLADSPADRFSIGEFLPKGTVLGIVGETGWAPSGLHIHLEIKRVYDFYGGYISDLSDHENAYEFILSRMTYNSNPPEQCPDGTLVDACSATKPLRCITGGYLVENSIVCGCETGVSQTDGSCSKTESGIIIDNDDPEFQYSGDWESTTNIMGFYGSDFLIASVSKGRSTASWTPNIPETGNYQVYGWWRDAFSSSSSSRATNAVITINHAGQQDQVVVDFTNYYKEWKYLGTFLFEAGESNSVVLSSTLKGEVVADAFRFVWDSSAKDTETTALFTSPLVTTRTLSADSSEFATLAVNEVSGVSELVGLEMSSVFELLQVDSDTEAANIVELGLMSDDSTRIAAVPELVIDAVDITVLGIPELNTLFLVGSGLIGIFLFRRIVLRRIIEKELSKKDNNFS